MKKMKGMVFLVTGLLFVALLSGCAHVASPVASPVFGCIYTGVRGPIAIANNDNYFGSNSKIGTASCFSLFGLFAFGDASIQRAMENGGIRRIYSVDYQSNSFLLGLIAKYKTIVNGEGEEEKRKVVETSKKKVDN